MIEKLTPEQLKAVFDPSDTSDVTRADIETAKAVTCFSCSPCTIRLLKHYHPELFVDPRLEAAKKLAREILAEGYRKEGKVALASIAEEGSCDDTVAFKAITQALLMHPPSGEGDDA